MAVVTRPFVSAQRSMRLALCLFEDPDRAPYRDVAAAASAIHRKLNGTAPVNPNHVTSMRSKLRDELGGREKFTRDNVIAHCRKHYGSDVVDLALSSRAAANGQHTPAPAPANPAPAAPPPTDAVRTEVIKALEDAARNAIDSVAAPGEESQVTLPQLMAARELFLACGSVDGAIVVLAAYEKFSKLFREG